jgi:hypothetical protein
MIPASIPGSSPGTEAGTHHRAEPQTHRDGLTRVDVFPLCLRVSVVILFLTALASPLSGCTLCTKGTYPMPAPIWDCHTQGD